MADYEAIPGWDRFDTSRPSEQPTRLDHGFDESKPVRDLDIEDMRQAATFRGGKCLSTEMKRGDLTTPLEWEFALGHRFQASPNLILMGGHWCPTCEPTPWNYDVIARRNPFLAQVWYASHSKEEENCYTEAIFKDMNE